MWIIDPLNGTHNYLRGIPHFSVSITMVEVAGNTLPPELFRSHGAIGMQKPEW